METLAMLSAVLISNTSFLSLSVSWSFSLPVRVHLSTCPISPSLSAPFWVFPQALQQLEPCLLPAALTRKWQTWRLGAFGLRSSAGRQLHPARFPGEPLKPESCEAGAGQP